MLAFYKSTSIAMKLHPIPIPKYSLPHPPSIAMASPLHLLFLFFFASSLLLIAAPVATSLSFTYNKFGTAAPTCSSQRVQNICLQGDATVDKNGVVQLTAYDGATPRTFSMGRLSHTQPLHLWDKASGYATDFTTTFSFAITGSTTPFADGITFFLSRYPSQLIGGSDGGSLGLVTSSNLFNVSGDLSFVAVEFDSFQNEFDPNSNHIGIDINSVRSAITSDLVGAGFTASATGNAQVSYVAKAQSLRVSLDYNGRRYELSYGVDLRRVLPEWVSVGFTGSTGALTEFNKILSWSFTSTL